jgi:hypothetical protein
MYSTNASLRLMKGSGELPVKAKAILAWCHIRPAELQASRSNRQSDIIWKPTLISGRDDSLCLRGRS